jgi:hypothetical protein
VTKQKSPTESARAKAAGRPAWVLPVVAVALLAVAIAAFLAFRDRGAPGQPANMNSTLPTVAPTSPAAAASVPAPTESMETAKAVIVTVENAYGPKVPTVAQALTQIERRSTPDDKTGRTFAILDADGWPTPEGNLHLQMHISSEKPGVGSLVYRPTGNVLWSSRILGAPAPALKELKILVDDGAGHTYTVDGSTNPPSVLDATFMETKAPVKQIWPDGAEREVTFIYSACGCPVKVTAKRVGERTVRVASKRQDGSVRPPDVPVIFPDDPAAVTTISRLMRW